MAIRRRGWRYLATRLNGDGTETLLEPDLPLEDVTITDTLSGDSAISGTIDTPVSRLVGPDGFPLIRPDWSTAIYAEADGVIREGAVVTGVTPSDSSLSIECTGFTGYGRDLPYTGPGWYGVQVDHLDVVRTIWSHIQTQRGGNIGLQLGTQKTGKKIGTELKQVEFDTQEGPVSFEAGPVKLTWYDTHDLQGMVDELASDGPFDYHTRHVWAADGSIQHLMEFGVPTLGRKRDDLRFVYGVNIFEPPSFALSGDTYASGALVLGSGDGPAMIHSVVEPGRQPGDGLRRIAVVEDSTLNSTAKATARANAEIQWRKRLQDISSINVVDHRNARLGDAQVGDIIMLEARETWITTSITVRILSISYQPANGKVAEYTVARTDKLTS